VNASPSILYTWTDEAPYLATHAFLPVIRAFAGVAGVPVETRDISLAGRVLAAFRDRLPEGGTIPDDLAELGALVRTPEANIIKLPNVSASIPQLKACIAELQGKGFALPDYPDAPTTDAEHEIRARYDSVKGSAVNPVLRQGNSDRRAPRSVKQFAQKNPPRLLPWARGSKTHVATMGAGDFRSNEQSVTMPEKTTVRVEFESTSGETTVLLSSLALEAGEILDASVLSRAHLLAFLAREVADAKASGVLFSLHLKATMMKVSDPILFGHAVRVFFAPLFEKHGDTFERLGVNPNNGIADLLSRVGTLPADEAEAIRADYAAALAAAPPMAMVDSGRGITNLHVPSDVIIDASIPPMIRDGGKMWGPDGALHDTKAVIPDSSYAGIYQAMIEDCQTHGALDPSTMGSVPNVGLMARKAEEYGSHDKTFEMSGDGIVRIVDAAGQILLQHEVSKGDLWRACQTKDNAVRDWVRLAVERARLTGSPGVFWLDRERAHDREIIAKVESELPHHDLSGVDLRILAPVDAMRFSLERIRRGEDTISVTGNVLRDYLTDLFPILELGTSARMLSIVPLLMGGGLFETGAGGSAPKHVQQFEKDGHLRWDSLGEYMALAASFQHLGEKFSNPRARILGDTLDEAVAQYLEHARSPRYKVHELDNRGSTYHLTRDWATALAAQTEDPELAAHFSGVATALTEGESAILGELNAAQGAPQALGGYFAPDPERVRIAMCPSPTLNRILDSIPQA
jgi:isocitrate dehydrogenase